MQEYLINEDLSLKDALNRLNDPQINSTLFLINKDNKLIGSITEGDIRRAILDGAKIADPILKHCEKKVNYLYEGFFNNDRIKELSLKFKVIPIIDDGNQIIDILDFKKTKTRLPVDVVIMAGGEGRRLLPLTKNTPKPLIEVGNKPIIDYNFEQLIKLGVKNFHISVRYLSDQIKSHFLQKNLKNININFIEEDEPLGTIGSLRLINKVQNNHILLLNSDILTNIKFDIFFQDILTRKGDVSVVTIPYEVDIPYAVLDTTNDNKVLGFKEKPKYTYFSNAGIYLLKTELLELIPKVGKFDATNFLQLIIDSKKSLLSYPTKEYWLDIGKHKDLLKAQKDIKNLKFE